MALNWGYGEVDYVDAALVCVESLEYVMKIMKLFVDDS